jgi:ribose transport system ATP-binding protein
MSSEAEAGPNEPVVRLRGVSKEFPGVKAVDGVDLEILPGEVHALAGENGAGKSTLMKILSQVEHPTEGDVEISGEKVAFHGPGYAQSLGVAMVYQEFALAPHLSVTENLFLGREPARLGFINRRTEKEKAGELLDRVGLEIEPNRMVSGLTVAEQQRLEIAKALAIEAKVVVLDEPTATLAEREIEGLFEVIRELASRGIAILYISHRLDEVFSIADRVTVMRDGKVVETRPASELTEQELVNLMVGREVSNLYPKPEAEIGDVLLRVEGISREGVKDCSFEVRSGEILGFAGLVGAGRTELARAVFGADPVDSGRVELEGREIRVRSPQSAIDAGIGYLTEDRKGAGLALQLGIDQNITLANVPIARAGFLDLGAEQRVARDRCEQLAIQAPTIKRKVQVLSGGNQQKVVVAKWLETHARALFFDEPSRGIDVGAKAEMFGLIGDLAKEGRGIVLISSYLPELLNMCDRILVMRDGRVAGVLEREEFSEERIVSLATGVEEEAA